MLSAQDVTGISAMIPTPCKAGQDKWSDEQSVDLDETARMIENLIQDGIGSIAANGTTGECAALTWEEKVAFTETIIQVTAKRIPVFAGVTTLGTKETVKQMRAFNKMGADGCFVGLPLWQTPTITNSVQFYADMGEAVPEMGIMIYANPFFFKSTFPTEFWVGIGKHAPNVICNKYVGNMRDMPNVFAELEASMDAAPDCAFLPIDMFAPLAYSLVGNRIKGVWSTSSAMGPEPVVALMDALNAGNEGRMGEIVQAMHHLPNPILDITQFASYNVQVEKTRCNAAGYVNAGPLRPPYTDLPEDWRANAEANGQAWAQLRQEFIKQAA